MLLCWPLATAAYVTQKRPCATRRSNIHKNCIKSCNGGIGESSFETSECQTSEFEPEA